MSARSCFRSMHTVHQPAGAGKGPGDMVHFILICGCNWRDRSIYWRLGHPFEFCLHLRVCFHAAPRHAGPPWHSECRGTHSPYFPCSSSIFPFVVLILCSPLPQRRDSAIRQVRAPPREPDAAEHLARPVRTPVSGRHRRSLRRRRLSVRLIQLSRTPFADNRLGPV